MHSKTTKIMLIALLATGFLAAFPIEPFDMHNTIGELIQEKIAETNKHSSQNPADHVWNPKDNPSSESKETSNDVDTGNSADCR